MRIVLVNLFAGAIDEENGLMMLICFGTSGTGSPLFTDAVGEIKRMVGDDEEGWLVTDGLPMDSRITRVPLLS